jgi:hypothetical protein
LGLGVGELEPGGIVVGEVWKVGVREFLIQVVVQYLLANPLSPSFNTVAWSILLVLAREAWSCFIPTIYTEEVEERRGPGYY